MKYVTNVKFKEWLQKKTRKKQRQLCSEVSVCIYNSLYMAQVSYLTTVVMIMVPMRGLGRIIFFTYLSLFCSPNNCFKGYVGPTYCLCFCLFHPAAAIKEFSRPWHRQSPCTTVQELKPTLSRTQVLMSDCCLRLAHILFGLSSADVTGCLLFCR